MSLVKGMEEAPLGGRLQGADGITKFCARNPVAAGRGTQLLTGTANLRPGGMAMFFVLLICFCIPLPENIARVVLESQSAVSFAMEDSLLGFLFAE